MFGPWNDYTFALFISGLITFGVAWIAAIAAFLAERPGARVLLGLLGGWLALAASLTLGLAINRLHGASGPEDQGEPLARHSGAVPSRRVPVLTVSPPEARPEPEPEPEPALLYVPITPAERMERGPEPEPADRPEAPEPDPLRALPRARLAPLRVELLPPEGSRPERAPDPESAQSGNSPP